MAGDFNNEREGYVQVPKLLVYGLLLAALAGPVVAVGGVAVVTINANNTMNDMSIRHREGIQAVTDQSIQNMNTVVNGFMLDGTKPITDTNR